MQRRITRRAAAIASAVTVAGLAGAAGAQSSQQRQQEYERQQSLERQFEQQQRQMQQQQRRARQQQFEQQQPYGRQQQVGRQRFGQQPMDPEYIDAEAIVVIGVDMDEDGRADATYFVPGDVVRRIAREHQNMQRQGRSMQFQPWQRLQQTTMRGEGEFEDLPLSSKGEMGGQVRQAQLSGTVTETRTAQLVGTSEPSKLAKVRLSDGSTVFADLGPAENLRNVRLSRGDQVAISGSPAWINNQPVIFAERLQTQEGVIPVRREQFGRQQQFGRQGPQPFRQQDRWQQEQRFGQQDQWQPRQDRFREQDQWRQQNQWEQQDRWQQQRQLQQQRFETGMGQQQMEHISGTITETDEVTIGDSEPYTFVKVRGDGGQTGWVSLGPSKDIEDLQLSRNDRIEVLAMPVELQGETVFYAHQLRAGGESMRISQKEGGQQGPRFQQAGMGQMQQISGTILNTKDVTIGDSDPYLFAKLRTDDGQTKWVNLGPKDQVEDLNLSRNDKITVAATEMDIHGETIFHARQVQSDGQFKTIEQTGHR